MLRIGVVRETGVGERRVALVPDGVRRLVHAGHVVLVERDAGRMAYVADHAYVDAGATLTDTSEGVYAEADTVVRVGRPTLDEARCLRPEAVVIGLLQPWTSAELFQMLAARGITAFSLERVPRIARAQSMDVLSSQSTVAGYKAALIGANAVGKFFPLMMTAAGTVAPTRVLVMGAGVAGLQAIATSRRLGAVVQGYDIRPAAKEQVESLGATFVSAQVGGTTQTSGGYAATLSEDAQQGEHELLLPILQAADVVITTALVPGRPAPVLITRAMVEAMAGGSVIVDIAAEAGGNCALTQPGECVVIDGVTIFGPVNLPSTLPVHASQLYSRNISNFLEHIIRDGQLSLDMQDVIVDECCVTHAGEVRHDLGGALVGAYA